MIDSGYYEYSYQEIAESWPLWCEYVNASGAMMPEEFDAMSVDDRIAFMVECFGPEGRAEDIVTCRAK